MITALVNTEDRPVVRRIADISLALRDTHLSHEELPGVVNEIEILLGLEKSEKFTEDSIAEVLRKLSSKVGFGVVSELKEADVELLGNSMSLIKKLEVIVGVNEWTGVFADLGKFVMARDAGHFDDESSIGPLSDS